MTLEKTPFGADRILELLPHRHPMLMIDRVLEIGDEYVRAEKLISASEPALTGHFPGRPIFPGVLIIEAMAQTAAVGVLTAISEPEKRGAYLTGVDKCRFRRPVVPGDQLRLEVEIVSVRLRMGKCRGVATVDQRGVHVGVVDEGVGEGHPHGAGAHDEVVGLHGSVRHRARPPGGRTTST